MGSVYAFRESQARGTLLFLRAVEHHDLLSALYNRRIEDAA
jgi:hypothetical protein